MMTDQHKKNVRLPRRRRSFGKFTEATVREIARQVIGYRADAALVAMPDQGINNQTYLVQPKTGPELAIKVRPRPAKTACNSPQWPRYTQALFGKVPNGQIPTLIDVTKVLSCHGAIRVPEVYLVDESMELVPYPYFVSEKLAGIAFDWDGTPVRGTAARQLGEHLGRIHRATASDGGFGIYARPNDFPAEAWWPRFESACRVITNELSQASPVIRAIRTKLETALQRVMESSRPQTFSLVCVDQSPSHYLGGEDGGISGMVDIESHLWAPREYELAMVALWIRDVNTFRSAYEEHLSWPEVMDQVRPAYWLFTWMGWIYCLHTLVHDG